MSSMERIVIWTGALSLFGASLLSQSITWNAIIGLPSIQTIGSRLQTPEELVNNEPLSLKRTDGDIRTVTTCADYLDAVTQKYGPVTVFAQIQAMVFVRDCFVLRDLAVARPMRSSYLPNWSYDLLAMLPPILEWGMVESRRNGQLGWAAFDPSLHGTTLDADKLDVEDDTASFSLAFLARADFNGDGVEDLAFSGSVSAKQGSYQRTDYMS